VFLDDWEERCIDNCRKVVSEMNHASYSLTVCSREFTPTVKFCRPLHVGKAGNIADCMITCDQISGIIGVTAYSVMLTLSHAHI